MGLQQRRLDQERERVQREAQAKQKVAAAKFARQYLSGLRQSVFTRMVDDGHFFDPLTKEVEEQFMPWLMTQVQSRLTQSHTVEQLAQGMCCHTSRTLVLLFALITMLWSPVICAQRAPWPGVRWGSLDCMLMNDF